MPGTPMRIAFLVNDVGTEVPTAATTVIAHTAAAMGHKVYMVGTGDLIYRSDGPIGAIGFEAPEGGGGSQEAFLAGVQGPDAEPVEITAADLDVLYLRYNPVEDLEGRPWEYDAGIVFGQMAVLQGLIVLSHPYTLSYALNKMYLEQFPADIRPRTVISRSYEEILRFHAEENGKIVVKPLRGYGGQDVYLVKKDAANLRQIVDSISRDSFVVAQEFLPEASDGDTRLFLFNGKPLVREGKIAAVRRVNASGDFRSNMMAGGRPQKAEVTPRMLEIVETVRPRLVADGIFDVGLDIVGDKLVEINTISSGGLNAASELEGVPFGEEVVSLIERKVAHRRRYGQQLRNRALAVMD
ncbi:MAG: glutathione synthase [Gemmatimonadota bacterium]